MKGISLSDAVKKMRGKPNTEVKLTILRKGEPQPLEFVVTRDVIRVKSVKSKHARAGLRPASASRSSRSTPARTW